MRYSLLLDPRGFGPAVLIAVRGISPARIHMAPLFPHLKLLRIRAGRFCVGCVAITICFAQSGPLAAEPVVWSGLAFQFNRPNFVEPPAVDQITGAVGLTRGLTAGLYNAS